MQEVNLLLWEKRDQFEPGGNLRAWAFATARFVVLGQRRRMKQCVLRELASEGGGARSVVTWSA